MARDLLFISHASPEDNPFVLWLSSRLQLLGYKVWVDLEQLVGGERDYWNRIEVPLRDHSAKFLLVVSRHSMMSDGVLKEFHFADQVGRENGITDFILPIWVERVPYSIRIGLSIFNKFDFEPNWAAGLDRVLEKLSKDGVPRGEQLINDAFFDRVRKPIRYDIFPDQKERYYSNWWEIRALPDQLYYFKYSNEPQAKAVLKTALRQHGSPIHRHGNVLVTFRDSLPTEVDRQSVDLISDTFDNIVPEESGTIETAKIINGFESAGFPSHRDAENFLKQLLYKGFIHLLLSRGLKIHNMAGKMLCFYFPVGSVHNRVLIKYPKKKKAKSLLGKYGDFKWHFGVSCRVHLKPVVRFTLKSHIVFSDDGKEIWTSAEKNHSARRKKGKTWFNEQWRDQLLAFIAAISTEAKPEITIPLSGKFDLVMPGLTMSWVSPFGYNEPITNDRQNVMEWSDEEEEVSEESNVTRDSDDDADKSE
jgi:hypothetical protein